MRLVAMVMGLWVGMAGCGRIGFDALAPDAGSAPDAGNDASSDGDGASGGDAAPAGTCGAFSLVAEPILVDAFHPFIARDGATLWFSDNAALFAAPLMSDGSIGTSARLVELDSVGPDIMPSVSGDAREIAFVRRVAGTQRLHRSTRATADAAFDPAVEIPFAGGDAWDPELSPDALTLYFATSRDTEGDIFVARRARRTGGFGAPEPLPGVNSRSLDGAPAVSADGLTLVFASARDGGDTDLYVATRAVGTEDFGPPAPLAELNSSGNDDDPALSPDGSILLFSSDRSGSFVVYRADRTCE